MGRLKKYLIEKLGVVDIEKRAIGQSKEIANLKRQAETLKRQLDVIYKLIPVDAAFDIHFRDKSWAVISINGKPEYVNFMQFRDENQAREVMRFLRSFDKANIRVDAPDFFRDSMTRI